MSATTSSPTPKVKKDPYPQDNDILPIVNQQAASDTWYLLLGIRFINALLVRTFFQPDEYFQSLEPAWKMAFGEHSGAWITWEWHHQLRSSLHPALFAIIYYLTNKPMELLGFFPQFRAMILAVVPNIAQSVFAAVGDYYTWQFSERIYGIGSPESSAVLMMVIFSPWQWFCSTRTFSNCLETTLTITALHFWPWELSSSSNLSLGSDGSRDPSVGEASRNSDAKDSKVIPFQTQKSIRNLRISLSIAALACILRPTNLLIWFSLLIPTLTSLFSYPLSISLRLLLEAFLCGSSILVLSTLSDLYYFREWTFPPYQFLNFNINQNLAVFYGRNDWHYYLSQGLPLLLTTYLPFTLIAMYKTTILPTRNIRFILTTTILVTIASLSLISHKEVRFIYPLLPILHILTAPTITSFFLSPAPKSSKKGTTTTTPSKYKHVPLLSLLLTLNLLIALYTTLHHQRGVLSLPTFLRQEYEALALDNRGLPLSSPLSNTHSLFPKKTNYDPSETFVAFLMPCHSTPWRSSLIHPGLKAWALSCEPPIHLAAHSKEREEYRDEADRFYDDMGKFLDEEVGGKERPWPRYVAGFEGIEEPLRDWYEGERGPGGKMGSVMRERWRTGNTQWHDDERRKGDVVVWEFVEKGSERDVGV